MMLHLNMTYDNHLRKVASSWQHNKYDTMMITNMTINNYENEDLLGVLDGKKRKPTNACYDAFHVWSQNIIALIIWSLFRMSLLSETT